MNNFNWQVKIVDVGCVLLKDVFIFRRLPNGKIEHIKSDGNTEVEEDNGGQIEPTIKLLPEILEAFSNELRDRGIKPKDQSMIEGKLEATKYHLEDMRQLLKLNK